MKRLGKTLVAIMLVIVLAVSITVVSFAEESESENVTKIELNNDKTLVNGVQITSDDSQAVYMASGTTIVHYEYDMAEKYGSTYGEATSKDAWHTDEECAEETHIIITQPGTYEVSGKLYGQLSIELPKKKAGNEVKLILNGVDIQCDVAPGILFVKAYEYDDTEYEDDGIKIDYEDALNLDYESAGAYVVIADDSVNTVTGSHVAKCYAYTKADDGTVTWTYKTDDNGNATTEQKKLAKYDGAFYSKVSMTIAGGEKGTGILNINSDNEGLDSEQHLAITGGNITINSDDDGINVNDEGGSVVLINGGRLFINAANGKEGDGIDSNGYLIISGGEVYTCAKPQADSGLDAENGVVINGGTVVALGSSSGAGMDRVSSACEQATMTLSYKSQQASTANVTVTDTDGNVIVCFTPSEAFGSSASGYSSAVISSDKIVNGETYTVLSGTTVMGYASSSDSTAGGMGGMGDRGGRGGMSSISDMFSSLTGGNSNLSTEFKMTSNVTTFSSVAPTSSTAENNGTPAVPNNADSSKTDDGNKDTQPQQKVPDENDDGQSEKEPEQSEEDNTSDTTFKYLDDGSSRTWNWATTYIYQARDYDLMLGDKSGTGYIFRADDNLTRGEAVTIVLALKDIDVDTSVKESGFSDSNGAWYTPYVAKAKELGITAGYKDGNFKPKNTITRAEFVTMIVSALGIEVDTNDKTTTFIDSNGAWYSPYVSAAAKNGLATGTGNLLFKPKAYITRAEAATMAVAAKNR